MHGEDLQKIARRCAAELPATALDAFERTWSRSW